MAEPNYSVPDGIVPIGCLPRTNLYGEHFTGYGESGLEVYSRNDWPDLVNEDNSLGWLVPRILSQGETHMCASFAVCSLWEILWTKTFGVQNAIVLSPSSIYNELTGGRPGGSSINENISLLMRYGALPAAIPSNLMMLNRLGVDTRHTMPLASYSARSPAGSDTTRELFRLDEVYDINSWPQLVSAAIKRYPAAYGRDRHAICEVSGSRRSGISIKFRNSYGLSYGTSDGSHGSGFGYDTEANVGREVGIYGGGAARSIVITDRHLRIRES